jgi:hypothetical protein
MLYSNQMSKFLRISNKLINTNNIAMVTSYEGEFWIDMIKSTHKSGFAEGINGFIIGGSGLLFNNTSTLVVKKSVEPESYLEVAKWYNNIKNRE